MNKVSDDKLPMTGTWYRVIPRPDLLGKVGKIENGMVLVIMTGGKRWMGNIEDFAKYWELS